MTQMEIPLTPVTLAIHTTDKPKDPHFITSQPFNNLRVPDVVLVKTLN